LAVILLELAHDLVVGPDNLVDPGRLAPGHLGHLVGLQHWPAANNGLGVQDEVHLFLETAVITFFVFFSFCGGGASQPAAAFTVFIFFADPSPASAASISGLGIDGGCWFAFPRERD